MKKELLLFLFALSFVSCKQTISTEKHQKNRDAVVDVSAKIQEIDFGSDLMVGSIAKLFSMGEYILILDVRSYDKLLHVIDKKNFKYLYSGIKKGRGPGEIVNPGHLMIDEVHHKFYIPDYGKLVIYSYALADFLEQPDYMPDVKMELKSKSFPADSYYIREDLLIGVIVEPIGNATFKQSMAKWSLVTGEIRPMPYEQPDIERRRINFAASIQNDLYVEVYHHHDLMTICDIEGGLKYNIYGPAWNATTSNAVYYYGKPLFCGDKIIVSYSGNGNDSEERDPTKLIVFNLDGDYIQTLETGYKLSDFCYDEDNNRLILSLNDEIQFAYLDLDGII